MDFLNQRKLNRTEICSAFGVPSQLVGDPEGQTYSNFGEAVKSFWENTIIPRYLEHIKQKLQSDLLPRYADNLVLVYDLSRIQALKESQDALTKRTVDLWKSGLIKRNEARFALDYEEVQDGDVFFNDLGFTTEQPLPSEGEQKSLDAKKNYSNSLSDSEIHFMIE
jgi:phage portal protein BeeE